MTGSLPLDPTAIEATIGTGGLPSQHGITGADIRNILTGKVVPAFGSAAPQPVIATLGDDLDLATHGATMIGLIGDAPGDQGLTGDDWYGGPASVLDRRANNARDVASFLRDGWGGDGVPDLLAVALSGSAASDRRATDGVVSQVLHAVPDATIIVAGTGSVATHKAMTAPTPAGADSMAAGGVFVDRGAGAVPPQDVVDELKGQTAPDGSPLFADAFASYAVRFGRYC
jgi:hypothetical protein